MAILTGDTPSVSVKLRHSPLASENFTLYAIVRHNLETVQDIDGMLVLIANRKSYMSFRVPKSVTLNDLERRNTRYIALFDWIW